ncbi:cobalamin biosynthesis family protein [Enterovibrio sp. ZSDZ35]|uniref:Cobalamin biosynthesis family protein n=1 Tax=Enterovibrio qingdaonensis TaxID=2899818 RepID=A0ABT5QU95_9GAMM|nr:cobalamin biosynthesis family protein [Enterovibrio sp. ZSDZ35]MDD1784080.1 cobalamin biosynthesis family protein [Enterovibrio sp. ZSDZ35]
MTELPTPFGALLDHSTLLAMWGALILHWFYPIPANITPLGLWRRVAVAIAEKVNHLEDPPAQQRLAGTLSLAIMWLTIAVLLIALKQLVWTVWLFDLLLLWFALGWKPISVAAYNVEQALNRDDKPTARTYLSKILNRDTCSLSQVGIAKAGCETLLAGYARGLIGVLFWYAIGGGIAAFLYALIVQLARCWPTRRQEYADFGLATAAFLTVLDWLPNRLFALLIAAGLRFNHAIEAIRLNGNQWSANGIGWLLASSGAKFQVALGGPAIYDNDKVSRPTLGGIITPSSLHLAMLNQQLRQKALIWIVIQSFFMWFAHGFL